MLGSAVVGALLFALAGCEFISLTPIPASCGWPQGTRLAFAGEASLAELGVGGSARSDIAWHNPRGMVYVTAERIQAASHVRERRYCVVYNPPLENGNAGGTGPVADDWVPPAQ